MKPYREALATLLCLATHQNGRRAVSRWLRATVPTADDARERRPATHSIAVLYFDNLSPDTADAYLADGVTEELINLLG